MGGQLFFTEVRDANTLYRMSRVIVLVLLVALAAVATAQLGNYYPFSGFNPSWYPNLQQGFGFYNYQPQAGFSGCQYWCRSPNYGFVGNNQYYCCTTPFQAGFGNQWNQFSGGYNQWAG